MNSFALAPGCALKLSSNAEICCKDFASFAYAKLLTVSKKFFILICSPLPHSYPSEYSNGLSQKYTSFFTKEAKKKQNTHSSNKISK